MVLFFADQSLVEVDNSIKLLDLVTLVFDPISIFLGEFKIELGYIVDGLALLVSKLHVFFERSNFRQELLDDSVF